MGNFQGLLFIFRDESVLQIYGNLWFAFCNFKEFYNFYTYFS